MDIKKRLEEIAEAHEKEMFITCEESCLCWDIEALIAEIESNESAIVRCDGGEGEDQ